MLVLRSLVFLVVFYAFQVEMAFEAMRAGATIVEAPIHFVERRQGASKMSWAVIRESIWMPWRLAARPAVDRKR